MPQHEAQNRFSQTPSRRGHDSAVESADQLHDLLQLRTIVAVLGERVSPPWWRTQFLTGVGLRTMTRVFPRTAASAALNSVMIAARDDHDKRIGIGHRYHLFRLPSTTEHAISLLQTEEAFGARTTEIVSKSPDDLIQDLAGIAQGREGIRADGPLRIGRSADIVPAGVADLAAHYRDSFQSNRRIFPYFDDATGRI